MRWGFQWGKVGTGAVMFLMGGGICVALWLSGGYVNVWAVLTAGGGLITMLSGLIGDEGVW